MNNILEANLNIDVIPNEKFNFAPRIWRFKFKNFWMIMKCFQYVFKIGF